MDDFELGQKALEMRQFHDAELFFTAALSSSTQIEKIHENLFACAMNLRPQEVWRELQVWVETRRARNDWAGMLELLKAHRQYVPQAHLGFVWESEAEAHFQLGHYQESRSSSSAHLEHLLRKKILPSLQRFIPIYRARFPHSFFFAWQELSAYGIAHDVENLIKCTNQLMESPKGRSAEWDDAGKKGSPKVLRALHEILDGLEITNGDFLLLKHRVYLTSALAVGTQFSKADWKKLVELIVHHGDWNNLRLTLEAAITQTDESLAKEVHQQILKKRGFSFVKFTQGYPLLKRWLLDNGHMRVEVDNTALGVEPIDWKQASGASTSEVKESQRSIGAEWLEDEESEGAQDNAIAQWRLSPPPPEILPDIIVAYRMLGFGKVVDWLLLTSGYPDTSSVLGKKIAYLTVLRAMERREFYHALALLEDLLGTSELGFDEIKEFKYAQAAAWSALGDKAKSKKLFAEVEQLSPGYRKAREGLG